jgi:two-component system sensor histidine kinase KdpD
MAVVRWGNRASLGRARTWGGVALAVGGSALLTSALVPIDHGPNPTVEVMLFLTVVVGAALLGGLWPALLGAVVATFCLNYYFTPPLHTLVIASPDNAILLGLFLVVAVAVSSVVDSAARRGAEATAARDEADTLTMLNRVVLEGESDIPRLLDLVGERFAADAVDLVPVADLPRIAAGDSIAAGTRGWALVLRNHALDAAERRILTAFATHLGVILDREELIRQRIAARELTEGNQARTALLAAVSHDLRTPLAAVKASVGTLQLGGEALAADERADLLDDIEESADTLSRIVADLLDMSRLTARAVEPILSEVDLGDVVTRALGVVPRPGAVHVEGRLPRATVDQGLVERVLANLLTNAVQHSRVVEVTGLETVDERVLLRVIDHGPGVPDELKERMFEPFERVGRLPKAGGVGLGLAVAKGLVEVQDGVLTVEDTPGGGLTVVLDLQGVPRADPRR